MPPTSFLPRAPSWLSEFRAFIMRSVVKSTFQTEPYSRDGLLANGIAHEAASILPMAGGERDPPHGGCKPVGGRRMRVPAAAMCVFESETGYLCRGDQSANRNRGARALGRPSVSQVVVKERSDLLKRLSRLGSRHIRLKLGM
jgi:hypothetical protein